jgi:hypothetical protein
VRQGAALLVLGLATPAFGACGDALGPGTLVAASPGYDVAFRPDAPIAVSTHFALDIAVCPRAGAALPTALDVDATMPAHRHGMNYRPGVTGTGPGRWRAEGLLFHMPGEWEFRFDLAGPAGRERATLRREIP